MKRNCFVGEVWSSIAMRAGEGITSVPYLVLDIDEATDRITLLNLEIGKVVSYPEAKGGLNRMIWNPLSLIKSSLSDHCKAR